MAKLVAGEAAHVLVTTALCSALPACCRPSRSATDSASSWVLSVRVVRVHAAAGFCCLSWSCLSRLKPSSACREHTQWFPRGVLRRVTPATPSADVALGRGAHDSRFERDNPLAELWTAEEDVGLGRFTLAKQYVHQGQRVLEAAAFAVVVRQTLVQRRCHWCFSALRAKAVQCGDCRFSRYCSRDCMTADAPLHDFQCVALRALQTASTTVNVDDMEAVRLALAVLSMEQFVQNPEALALLVTNRQSNNSQIHSDAIKLLTTATGGVVSSKHVRVTLERVRCNAHPLFLDGVTCVGSGVFPEAAMTLNHSCLPNVTPSFDPRTRMLAFHAIVGIPLGHAVECSYIELLQARARRQELLSAGFGFHCVCQRCTLEEKKPKKAQRCEKDQDEDAAEEARAMEQLMLYVGDSGKNVSPQQLSRLKNEYSSVFERNSEAQFALHSTEMRLTRAQGDWAGVLEAAKTLLDMWGHCGLPANYPTTETLYLQIHVAAKQTGNLEASQLAAQRVKDIRRICGYTRPEASVL